MYATTPFDDEAYLQRVLHGPCFTCELIAGNPDYAHHIIFQDDRAIVFLNKYPTLYGYTLVAPKEHREHVTADFSPEEFATLLQLIYRVGEAVRRTVPTERLYLLSLGSQQGNSHVHWHIAPLPPGVPFLQQQFEVFRTEEGILDLTDEEMETLARRIRSVLDTLPVQ
jgi:diadenosine tetraphosphate (Ap4A) HIT family hydrolase